MDGATLRLCYVACPTSLTLQSANAIQTWTTLRELRLRAPLTLALIPRFGRERSRFSEVGARHLPRPALGKLSRLYRSTLWYYAERSVFAAMTAAVVLFERFRGRRVDVVYVRDAICAGWWAGLFGRLLHVPVVYEVHDLESANPSRAKERFVQPLLRKLDETALRRSAAVASLTEDFRRLLAEKGWRRPEEVRVIPDAFDDQVFGPGDREEARRRLGRPSGEALIVYAGMTFAYRGIDRLLDAFARVRGELTTARLALIGGRPQDMGPLRMRATSLGLEHAIEWQGQLPQAEVIPWLHAADVLVIPDTVTDVTASPLKLFEYLATGRVVVLPDIAALAEVLPSNIGYAFRRGDTGALAEALLRALRDPARLSREQAGLQAVRPHTYGARAEKILDAAASVTGAARTEPRRTAA
jgi:glycosyltransferase involved in cell wall biosynthesis